MADDDEAPKTLSSLRKRSAGGRRIRVGGSEVKDRARLEQEQMGLLFAAAREAAPGVRGRATVPINAPEPASLVAVPHAIPPQSWTPERRVREVDDAPDSRAERGSYLSREPHIWGVRAIVNDLRERVEGAHREVLIEGEISTCRPASSGHLYLTLKEGETQLSVVMFRRQVQLLRFRPATGMTVLARGRLSVYEGRGELQLIAESLEPRGTGALLAAFERLKERLAAEGLFDVWRKRQLPPFPRTVGVVTSTAGAVLHDVVTVARRRHAPLHLLVYPARVQGAGCASSIAAGVRWFNCHAGAVDLILLARGGGSPEDLCGFNDEALARAIAASELPVVSAIGHETDFTIADFVADVRAPTPSAAAEMITEWQHRLAEQLAAVELRLRRSGRMHVLEAKQRFARVASATTALRLQSKIDRRAQRVDELAQQMLRALENGQRAARRRLDGMERALERQQMGSRLRRDGERLERVGDRLRRASQETVALRRSRVLQLESRLEALSPLAVLARGYALVYSVNEGNVNSEEKAMSSPLRLVRSSTELRPGQRVMARLGRGTIAAEVTETDPR